MTPEQSFKFRGLLSNALNARSTGQSDERQLAHEDHLRNFVDGMLDEQKSQIERFQSLPVFSEALLNEYGEYEKYKKRCEADPLLHNTDPRTRFYASIFSMVQSVIQQWRKTQP